MTPQFSNKVVSSFMLWLDNKILKKGDAYTNHSSRFYKVNNTYSNYHTYALPFKQIIIDSHISGATLMTGITLNSTLITTGTSGLVDINYNEGQAYFTGSIGNNILSGQYSFKDFNIYSTSESDETLLFETKISPKPQISQTVTGLMSDEITYPCIFVKFVGHKNKPFAFGGLDNTYEKIRCIALCDSEFKLDALASILGDTLNTNVPFLTSGEFPYNALGGLTSGVYHYQEMTREKISNSFVYVENVDITRFNFNSIIMTELKNYNSKIRPLIADFTLCIVRNPRL